MLIDGSSEVKSIVTTVVRSVLISVTTSFSVAATRSSVMVVTIIRLAKGSEILSSSHEVVQTMSSRVYVGLVSSRLIARNLCIAHHQTASLVVSKCGVL